MSPREDRQLRESPASRCLPGFLGPLPSNCPQRPQPWSWPTLGCAVQGQSLSPGPQQAVPARLSGEGDRRLLLFLLLAVGRVGRGIGATLVIFQGQVTVRVCVRIWEVGGRSQLAHLPLLTLSKTQAAAPPPPTSHQGHRPHHAAGLDLPGIGCLGPPGQGAPDQGSVWTPP